MFIFFLFLISFFSRQLFFSPSNDVVLQVKVKVDSGQEKKGKPNQVQNLVLFTFFFTYFLFWFFLLLLLIFLLSLYLKEMLDFFFSFESRQDKTRLSLSQPQPMVIIIMRSSPSSSSHPSIHGLLFVSFFFFLSLSFICVSCQEDVKVNARSHPDLLARADLFPALRTLMRVMRMVNRSDARDRLKDGVSRIIGRRGHGLASSLALAGGGGSKGLNRLRLLKRILSIMGSSSVSGSASRRRSNYVVVQR